MVLFFRPNDSTIVLDERYNLLSLLNSICVMLVLSQDTDAPTRCLLEENDNFGMSQTQIKFIRQEKVGEGGMNSVVLLSNSKLKSNPEHPDRGAGTGPGKFKCSVGTEVYTCRNNS